MSPEVTAAVIAARVSALTLIAVQPAGTLKLHWKSNVNS
jgi:hypothetical protein